MAKFMAMREASDRECLASKIPWLKSEDLFVS